MKSLQIVVPMAGHGARFKAAGYLVPKPMILVGPDKPMIQVVVDNLGFRGDYHFFVLREHAEQFILPYVLKNVTAPFGRATLHETATVTQGQACSVLRVLDHLCFGEHGGDPVIVANSDQFVDGWHPGAFMDFIARHDPDGAILTFHGTDPKWSFVRCDPDTDRVVEVAEKRPISDRAVVGVFYAKSAELLRTAIVSMMGSPDKKVNGEWYLAPAYNEIIVRGFSVEQYPVPRMYGIGTPPDLLEFEKKMREGKVRV